MRQKKKPKAIPTPLAALLLLLIVTVNVTWSQVNQLTGMATQQVQIASGVTLQYTSDIDNTVKTRNELSTGGWCGLGWKFGFPSISVMHNNTVDLRDDRWFYDDGYGNVMEIVRGNTPNFPGTFYLRNTPQKKIEIYTNNTSDGILRIYGWKIHELDGSKMLFGYDSFDPNMPIPYLPCLKNRIGKWSGNQAATDRFYHRWPLREITGSDGLTTKITYTCIEGQTPKGLTYTKESYPTRIDRPDGSAVTFTLGTKNKDVNEGAYETTLNCFDFMETKFLRGVSAFDVDGEKLEQVTLLYSGDPGQRAHIRGNSKGFAERLLTGIAFKRTKGSDRLFSYDTDGFLTEVSTPETGSKTTYTYKSYLNDIFLSSSFITDFGSGISPDRNVRKIGNHIFCWRNDPGTGQLEFEVYSRVGYEWRRIDLDGPYKSGVFSTGIAELLPYNDCFAVHSDDGSSKHVDVYQWADDKWNHRIHFTTQKPPFDNDYRLTFGPGYLVGIEYVAGTGVQVTVYGDDETTYTPFWEELESVTYPGSAVEWIDFDIATAKDYFVFAWNNEFVAGQPRERKLMTFRKTGATWAQHDPTQLIEHTNRITLHSLIAMNDYFVATNHAIDDTGGHFQNITIRRWSPYFETFLPEMFSGTYLNDEGGYFKWPRFAELYAGDDYIVLFDKENLSTFPKAWMMIYRHMKNTTNSMYSWKRTYIQPTDASCAALRETDAYHLFPNNSVVDYAKRFRNSGGGMLYIENVYCSDRHFLVTTTEGTASYLWDFRWTGGVEGCNDPDVDNACEQWVSTLQGSTGGVDIHCQGTVLNNTTLYNQSTGVPSGYAFPDFNAIVTRETVSGQTATVLRALNYDFESGTYALNILTTDRNAPGRKMHPDFNGYYCLTETGTNPDDDQILLVGDRYHDTYKYIEAKAVERVTMSDELGYQAHTSFDYHPDNYSSYEKTSKKFFNTAKGHGIYNFATSFTSDASGTALTGKTTTEYCVDSSLGFFGGVYAVSQHRQNASDYFNDDTVRINGFLMELDGYTPNVGWVCIGDGTTPDVSTKVPVNPVTGYFSVKMENLIPDPDNPSGPPINGDFALYHFPTPDNSVFKKVFEVYRLLSSWRLDYPGNDGDFFTLSTIAPSNNRKEMNWSNVKINFGGNKTVWNRTRRPKALGVTYNFYGKEEIRVNGIKTIAPRSVRNVKISGGVHQVTATPFDSYDYDNNMPSLSYTVNSDGSFLVNKSIFAHDIYTTLHPEYGMDAAGWHMLVQPAGKITYSLPMPENIEWETANNTVLQPVNDPFDYALLTGHLTNLGAGDKIYVRVSAKLNGGVGSDDVNLVLGCNGTTVASEEITLENSTYTVGNLIYTVGNDAINDLQLTISGVDVAVYLHSIRCDVVKRVHIDDVNNDYTDRVVSASAVTWEQQAPANKWRQKDQWVWNVPLDSTTGLPQETFEEFDYERPDSNLSNHWEKKSTVDKYSSFSRPVQVTAAGKPVKTVVYGKNEHIPVAKVINATFGECGVFTGDYQCREDETNYWDKENGWEKGTTNPPVLDATDQHFGQKSIIAENDYGALRTFLITPGKGYTLSAWVKTISGTVTLKADALWSTADDFSDTYAADGTDRWHLMTVEIPSTFTNGLDVNQEWYVRAWVGGEPGGAAFKAAIDDIRFGPTKALISSTYYDTLWRQPIVTVDANNNPGVKTVYDEYGRPVEFFRIIDKGDLSTAVRMQSKKYRLMGDGDPPAYSYGYEAGTPDWSDKDGCGVTAVETMGGHSGTYRLVVTKAYGCIAYKTLDTPQVPSFENSMCVYRGFYRISSSSNPLRVGVYAKTGSGDIGVGSGYLPYAGNWTPFEVYFDMRGIAAGSTNQIEFRFTSENDAVTSFDMDDETIQTMY